MHGHTNVKGNTHIFSDYLKPDKVSFKMLLLRVYSHASLHMSREKKKIEFFLDEILLLAL